MDAYIIIIALAVIIIISHFLNIYSEKTGVPSVLILILFGALLQLDTNLFSFEILNESTQKPLLKILGISGLILILLEAALDLKINKTMMFASIKAFKTKKTRTKCWSRFSNENTTKPDVLSI